MPKDMMWECEIQKWHVDPTDPENHSKRTLKWVEVKVSTVSSGFTVRCRHCHGPVKIHRQRQTNGMKDHVQHRDRDDSENCLGGHYYKGVHRMSPNAIE